MERHFERSLQDLLAQLALMTAEVTRSLDAASQGLILRDASLCHAVFEYEKTIDSMEVSLDEMILDFIALHQPVATDLRFILSLQDAVVDLERIGDHCTNIAQSAVTLSMLRQPAALLDLPEMLPLARTMLHDSMEAFRSRNTGLARRTMGLDDRMDEYNRSVARSVIRAVKEDRELIETCLEILRISKNLERIGDLSANIAEDAIFIAEGKVVRHQPQG